MNLSILKIMKGKIYGKRGRGQPHKPIKEIITIKLIVNKMLARKKMIGSSDKAAFKIKINNKRHNIKIYYSE